MSVNQKRKRKESANVTERKSISHGLHDHEVFIGNPVTGRQLIKFENHFGFFITSIRGARNYTDLKEIITDGLKYKSVRPLVAFLELNTDAIAQLTGVSPRTISRWKDDTVLGPLPSKKLVQIDNLIQRGTIVFGGENEFKDWLNQTNIALGDQKPIEMISMPYGVELVMEGIEALEFGNVL